MEQHGKSSLAALTLGAIGVVYGDIGTSVLYAMKEVFGSGHVAFTPDNVFGILSIFFWTLTTIVSVKYVLLVLRADNNGEGGLVAMLALASMAVKDKPALRNKMMLVGIFGTCLFYGDGVITPAISVLSAVEGLEVVSPGLKRYVIPLTLFILFGLFFVQKNGTSGIGKFFGPITLVWFGVIAALGVYHIVDHPEILWALSPHHALRFMFTEPEVTFLILGAVVLCVTGGEALYADMGHFGKKPIRLAWFAVVMPCLVLNYFGQGALLLAEPEAVKNPFYMMAPDWLLVPLVCLATAATVIASQALITGAFSVTKQVVQMGFLPRLQVLHTSVRDTGQIYIPLVNWGLFAIIVLAVAMFKSSSNLAAAYGIAVCTDMLITTVLTFFVIRYSWKYPLWLCLVSTGFFFVVDITFWASNLLKLVEGGWFPLLIASVIMLLMLTWRDGRAILYEKRQADALELRSFLEAVFIAPPLRVEGSAVFLTSGKGSVPNAMLHNLKHNKVLHKQNLFVNVQNHEVPWIEEDKRLEVEALGNDCWQVVVHYGFKDDPDVPGALSMLGDMGCKLEPMSTSYFLSRDSIVPTVGAAMSEWREKLFSQMHLNASSAADFLNLPSNSVVELGSKIEI
ncbi:MAG: potassium transporter Kup [Burkholderiales bacterium 35-55-47]|jgi:KUP system potassium uptake protein|uniref:potassium transporter Kup n=1 Tax=Limnohabitans sp. TaxID=1907725 RepID=UPI000BD9DF3A|nr:potassium transporter Kup [Limnohabitans sp.]OYY18509.1 MAG: potassium transporter Kup [Burkholderiales bacterium 35-55-47]OYZ72920.1 MAG: potassium transporter Kup [Burkholderiales bacterium 24-55-52]OZA99409.1 MAG: potassium transporter Kup [Burkholderiales bacterium 39-55-53]HQR87323.1 potassium transporter Kup [Limnohabitans sp.]HQS27629.1 potassium transporter Kup [Limnohabitans sp.]